MDVKIVGMGYMVDNRPRSLLGFLLTQYELDKAYKLSDADAVVLTNINLHLKQGGVNVLMGLGIGHKCLLECIALRQREGLMSGKIMYDGAVRMNGIFKDMAFIHDLGVTHFSTLSVFDYLFYGARLRVSHDTSECRERARQAAKVAGLDGTRRIGSLGRAELRILDIAAELVSNPSLICLIDPCEGLDAASKVEVMKVLKAIASRVSAPTTVVFNASSLDMDTLPLIDQLALFSGKQLEYVCSLQRMQEISFTAMAKAVVKASLIILDDLAKPPQAAVSTEHSQTLMKVIEDMLHLEASHFKEGSLSPLSKLAAQHAEHRKTAFFSAKKRSGEAGLPVRYRKTVMKEFSILAMRSLKYHYHNAIYLRMTLYRFTVLCILLGGLAYNAGETMQDAVNLVSGSDGLTDKYAYNATSVCFILVAMSLVGVAFTVPNLHANVKLLKFEVNSGLQGTVASWLSLLLVDVPVYMLIALIVSLTAYFMVSIQGPLSNYLGTTFMIILIGYSLALNCAVWCSSIHLANLVFACLALFFLLFCGFLQPISNLPALWYWTSSFTYTRWAFESLMISTFTNAEDGEAYLDTFNFENSTAPSCNGYQLLWLMLLQGLVVLGLLPPWSSIRFGKALDILRGNRESEFQAHDGYTDMDRGSHSVRITAAGSGGWSQMEGSIIDHHDIYAAQDNIPTVNELNQNRASINGLSTRRDSSSSKQIINQLHVDKQENIPTLERSMTTFALNMVDSQPKVIFVPKTMVTTLTFQRVKYFQDYTISSASSERSFSEPVLNGISGGVSPGNCCCIVDGQGDQSSLILLQILAGMGQATAYVQRGDVPFISSLTVREAIRYAALLRRTDQHSCTMLSSLLLSKSANDVVSDYELIGKSGDVEDRVSEVLAMCGLEAIADQVIGSVCEQSYLDKTRGIKEHRDKSLSVARHLTSYQTKLLQSLRPPSPTITPAQLRLVTIGMELVNRSGLIFLEDPFWGLQWQDAERVAVVLKTLAEGNRTIICNIHKPVLRVVQYFNDIMLLGSGLLLYSGSTESAAEYFGNIGYARAEDQNELDYLLDIAGDRAKMTMNAGKRAAALSPEDLADLNRSLANIKAGRTESYQIEIDSEDEPELKSVNSNNSATSLSSNHSMSSSNSSSKKKVIADYYYAMDDSPKGSIKSVKSFSKKERNIAVTRNPRRAPTGPTAWVLLSRGFQLQFADKSNILWQLGKCLIAGLFMGSVWFQMDNEDVQARISLFATMYIALNLQIASALEGIYRRKELFVRESFVHASNYVSHYLMDSVPTLVIFAVGSFLTVSVAYGLAGLRAGGGPFFYLYVIVFMSLYVNYALAYALSMQVSSVVLCKMIYTGILIPLQLLMSGYLILIPTMQAWSKWGSYICPMTYFLAGALRNECQDNSRCLSDALTYDDISDHYGYHMDLYRVVAVLLAMGIIYKLSWLVTLRLHYVVKQRAVRRKVIGFRKKARKILKASLRWSENMSSSSRFTEDPLAELEIS